MHITVLPSSVSGTLRANPSKSHAQRAIALATLATGTSTLTCTGLADDVKSALAVANSMGARIEKERDTLIIVGRGLPVSSTWDCGESGLCLRMFSAIAALFDYEITLTARGTLQSRPEGFMADTFAQLGVSFDSDHGFPPLRIHGPYLNRAADLDGSTSSQFLTGLLIALPLVQDNFVIRVKDLRSRPYIDLTLRTMQDFDVQVRNESYTQFHIEGNQHYRGADLHIVGDWSGMASVLVAAALTGEVCIVGLPPADTQADGMILEVLLMCGAVVRVEDGIVYLQHHDLDAFEIDCVHCPDLFPPLVALAACCNGTSRITGVHRLKTKESDRGKVLMEEFGKLGVRISHFEDVLEIEGGDVQGGSADACNDHRIAMALAAVALKAKGPVIITGAECVAKSYPDFFQDLASVGASIQYQNADHGS